MALDGITLSLIKKEIENTAVDARVDKIHQPSREELVMALRWRGGTGKLFMSAAAGAPRVHFTQAEYDNPKSPPMFCMLMRKYLCGARLTGIEQFGLERILHFKFATFNELGDPVTLTLAVEIMGRHSNIILVGDDGRVIDSIKRVTADMSSVRQVMPGMKYVFPPSQNKVDIFIREPEAVTEAVKRGRDIPLSKALLEVVDGVSPIICREISELTESSVDPVISDMTPDQLGRLTEVVAELADRVKSGSTRPTMLVDKLGHPFDFTFMDITQYESEMSLKYFDTYSEMLDRFCSERGSADRMRQRSGDLFRFVMNLSDRISRKLDVQRQELARSADREELRIKGELIHSNIRLVEKGMTSVVLENYYDEGNPITIKLDPRLTPAQNAQHYYVEYRKADNAERVLKGLIESGEREQDYIDSVFDMLTRARTESEIGAIRDELAEQGYLKNRRQANRKPEKLPPLEYVSDDGFRILCGRSNIQNDKLTLKDSGKRDIWLHTQKIHGSHTIIVTDGTMPPPRTLEQAAVIAAYNSKARDSSMVPVDYTEVRNVKKPGGAAPGMVIYEHYKTAYVHPDAECVERLRAEKKN